MWFGSPELRNYPRLFVVLVKGTLTVKQGMKSVVSMSGTFAGEWGKSVVMKNAQVKGLFETSTETSAAAGESQ